MNQWIWEYIREKSSPLRRDEDSSNDQKGLTKGSLSRAGAAINAASHSPSSPTCHGPPLPAGAVSTGQSSDNLQRVRRKT